MKRPSRVSVVHASFLVFALAIVGKAAYVQVWQANAWQSEADQLHTRSRVVPAPRGTVFDAGGTVLVETRQLVRVSVAPRDVRPSDSGRLAKALAAADVPRTVIAKAMDRKRAWVVLPDRYLPSDAAVLTAFRGVHGEVAMERVPSPLIGLRGLIGHSSAEGAGLDGVELALDSLLRGIPGKSASVLDGRRNAVLTPELHAVAAVPGHSLTLTIRFDLQDISERALADAMRNTGAHGGDIVVLDPRSGELLALASRRSDPRASTATALTEPVEPGSTLKPFVAAALLEHGRVDLDEVIQTHNGEWSQFGYKLTDVHRAPQMTFAQVIEHSSNIGMAKVASRLTPREEYEVLRNFGFGIATGLPFPSEANGRVSEPRTWSALTASALARGYEMLATPVQLAMAYGALANGGELLQPALVKEIRDPDGKLVYEHQRRVVRRAISTPIAAQMRKLLRSVVDSGSATRADLATFEVGGKSGTARRTGKDGKYVPGDYTATFVGLFPADEPQLVVLVKLDSPDITAYYGGQVAAPVTKAVLEAALASRDAVLDRSRLKQREQVVATNDSRTKRAADADAVESASDDTDVSEEPPPRIALSLVANDDSAAAQPSRAARSVPSVRGMTMRAAVATLHQAGFRVRIVRGGQRGQTLPAAGAVTRAGALVRLYGL
ncbi:MAG TPA: penicillin-binding transpeptidase domain-containing protein [Gemmatimonadaceae bacterium]|nr:penicillin-binding transpeptidase domain-containing protein [Gemmatimonadaceae bacterium]